MWDMPASAITSTGFHESGIGADWAGPAYSTHQQVGTEGATGQSRLQHLRKKVNSEDGLCRTESEQPQAHAKFVPRSRLGWGTKGSLQLGYVSHW